MSGPQSGKVSVVIPVTDANVDAIQLLREYSRPLVEADRNYEFVFVLDGVSGRVDRDLSGQVENYPLEIVRLQGGGLGESIALSAGVDRASGEFIINAPQYLQIVPDDLLKVLQALESDADFVATWRHPRVDPWLNRMQSRLFNWFLRVLMGIQFHDLNSSLRGMKHHVLDEVSVYGELYRFLPVLAMRQGFGVVEIKVRHREEKGRTGFYGIGVYVRRLLDILAITFLTRFTQKPLRFFGTLGILSIVLGVALCVDPLIAKLGGASLLDRPIFVLGTVLGAFGIQLIGFGLVGEIIIFTQSGNLGEYKIDEHVSRDAVALTDEDAEESEQAVPELSSTSASVVAAAPDTDADEPASFPVRVRELLPGEDARWDAFVRDHDGGTFFHLSGWRKVVEDVFGHVPYYLVAERGREWLGVLPLFWVKSPFVGKNMISLPYAVYGGVLAADGDEAITTTLKETARAQGVELSADYVELRNEVAQSTGNPTSDLYVIYRKELPKEPGEVMAGIPKKARAEVRHAHEKFHLKFEESKDLAAFFQLFSKNKGRLGTPSLPLRWFKALFEEFGSNVVIHAVRTPDDQMIAAVMSFCHKGAIYAYYSGSNAKFHRTGVNDFIYAKIMEWGVEKGFHTFDFGRSRADTGAGRFKRNMGFEATPLQYEYMLLHEAAELPNFHPSNPRLRLWQRVWSGLPSFIAKGLGGRLSRYLP